MELAYKIVLETKSTAKAGHPDLVWLGKFS